MPLLKRTEEFVYSTIIETIDRYNMVMRKNDADGNGDVQCIAVIKRIIFGRSFNNNKLNIVGYFKTGTFINVE